ncbi:MAG: spermine/spermidine synthase family protein, partial [Cyanobacteria bacterium RYN_339]|nr:spermine/spermidine synthase family protein [Cyanobacteria bacterium RYN_339]
MPPISRAVTAIFFLSGATGLVFEVLWSRYLCLVMGNTAAAQAAVLAVFLGGLALGNAWLGPRVDRTRNALAWYGRLEVAVGLWAALSPLILTAAGALYVWLARTLGLEGAPLTVLRMTITAAALLPATTLMGGSLPALARHVSASLADVRRTIAWLYFWNSAGAALGSLAAGYVLIPAFGLDATLVAGGLINVALGALALRLARGEVPAPAAATAPTSGEPPYGRWQIRWVVLVALVSGFIALGLEVAWIRLLAITLGASTYAFSLAVAGFICGIALGSLLVDRPWLPGKTSLARLGWAQAGGAAGLLVTVPFYDRLPYMFLLIAHHSPRTLAGYALLEASKLVICLAMMLVPTTFMGMALPLATRVATRTLDEVGARVGLVYALNTLGTVAGALLAGAWLMPWLGLRGMFDAAAFGTLALALGTWWQLPDPRRHRRVALTFSALVAFQGYQAWGGGWAIASFFTGSLEDRGHPLPDFQSFRERQEAMNIVYAQDGPDGSVAVVIDDGLPTLRTNGKGEASTTADMPTQVLLGQLPCILHPDAREVLQIGLGSGISAGAVLTHPIERLDVVELGNAVPEAARVFGPFNHQALDDPRLRLVHEDGLAYMQTSTRRYDVIVSEPSNMWIVGVGNLFTRDFYALAREHLKPGGLLMQWFQGYYMNDEGFKVGLRTLQGQFPYVEIWQGTAHDLLMVASAEPLRSGPADWARHLDKREVADDLRRIGIEHPSTL